MFDIDSFPFAKYQDFLGLLHLRFDTAKEVVNTELANFSVDVMDSLEKIDSVSREELRKTDELLILAQKCVEMTSTQFRVKCATIVQDLTEKRQQCHRGLLKWLLTRMLFILTRCTRLLQFQKDKEPINERSLHKFKTCLESIPAVEIDWFSNSGIGDSTSDYDSDQRADVKCKQKEIEVSSLLNEPNLESIQPNSDKNVASTMKSQSHEMMLPSRDSCLDAVSKSQEFHSMDDRLQVKSVDNTDTRSFCEQGQYLDSPDSVICRICEESVPICHLESHSYICAYADKWDLNGLDVDDRLIKLAEILEQIVESRNLSVQAPYDSLENSKTQPTNSQNASENFSPKISECRRKGFEGIFEEIHEMDTAFINENFITSINLKTYLGMKLSNHAPTSSTGSMTSSSSTSTPRAGHFDSLLLEINSPCGQEDRQQVSHFLINLWPKDIFCYYYVINFHVSMKLGLHVVYFFYCYAMLCYGVSYF